MKLLLWPLSKLYGAYVQRRRALYENGKKKQKRLQATVVSVGNLTVGGTGKTPMVLWLAQKFLAQGKRVAILTRGYRGSQGTSDEAAFLQRRLNNNVLFGIGPDRFANGKRLESQHGVDIFLLDDGFQHLQLARDLDILMIDMSRKLNRETLLPAGNLREPLRAVERADILILSRTSDPSLLDAIASPPVPTFCAQTKLITFRKFGDDSSLRSVSEIGSGPFLAFCGIGNPDAFFDDLGRWRVPVVQKLAFRDHNKYSLADLRRLQSRARASGAVALVTTEKDAENLPHIELDLPIPIWVAVIDLAFSNESELLAAIDRKLASRHGAAA